VGSEAGLPRATAEAARRRRLLGLPPRWCRLLRPTWAVFRSMRCSALEEARRWSHLGVYRSAARDFRNATAQRGHILDS